MDKSGTDEAICHRREVTGAIWSLVNSRDLQLECARVLHEALLMPALVYSSEKMRMNKVQNAQIRELCGVMKGVDERMEEGVLHWFGYDERIENYKIAKRMYVEDVQVLAQLVWIPLRTA